MEAARAKEGNIYDRDYENSRLSPTSSGRIRLSYFNLFWIFIFGSIAGLLVETLVSTPIDGRLEDRAGLLRGLFSPIYGSGAVLMTLFLNRLWKKNVYMIFGISAIVGASFEFLVGWLLENVFGIVAWSYNNQPFSIGGHTSLGMAIIWGIAGVLWIKLLLPWLMGLIRLIPERIAKPLTAILTVFMIVNISMTLLSFDCWFNRKAEIAPANPVQEFFAEHYNDEFMEGKFQTLSIYSELTFRDKS
ncbi:MAG: putative ABC transporter permease [Raoultibacter sp.]|jgi:uncharacterized membrane protein